MRTQREVLQQALEALERADKINQARTIGELQEVIPAEAAPQPGYVLVPMKPTQEMIEAGNNVEDLYRRGTPETWGKVYRAMIAAAPPAGAQEPLSDERIEDLLGIGNPTAEEKHLIRMGFNAARKEGK